MVVRGGRFRPDGVNGDRPGARHAAGSGERHGMGERRHPSRGDGRLDPETVEVLEASTERDVCSRLLAMLGAGWLADTIGRPRSACATNGVPNLAPVPTTLMPFHGRPLGSR